MPNIIDFQPTTVDAFKKLCKEKKSILEYMVNFGNGLEPSFRGRW